MFRMSTKVVLVTAVIGLFSIIGCKGYAQPVDIEKINSAFQVAMNEALYPQELSMHELSDKQIRKIVLPSAAKIISNTIKLVHERTGKDIGVEDVFAALPPKLEEGLDANKEQLTLQIEDILKKDK